MSKAKKAEVRENLARRFEMRGRYKGQRRELRLVSDRGSILKVCAYYHGVNDPLPLRADLERVRNGWEASGQYSNLRIADVPYPRWR